MVAVPPVRSILPVVLAVALTCNPEIVSTSNLVIPVTVMVTVIVVELVTELMDAALISFPPIKFAEAAVELNSKPAGVVSIIVVAA